MIYVLIISMIVVTCLFYFLIKKTNYELKGLEILLYQLSFLFLFHIGKYYRIDFYQEYITIYLLILLLGYYVLRFIKSEKGIGLDTIISYLLIMIVNSFSTTFLNKIDFFDLALSNSVSVYNISIFVTIILFDLVILFISKKKKIELKKGLDILKNKISIIFILLLIPSSVAYKYLGLYFNEQKAISKSIDYLSKEYGEDEYLLLDNNKEKTIYFYNFIFESKKNETYFLVRVDKENFDIKVDNTKCLNEQECLEKAEKAVNQYLKEQYGMMTYKKEDVIDDDWRSYNFTFTSEYIDGTFTVKVDKDSLEVYEDDFKIKYYSKILGTEFKNFRELNEYFSTRLEEKIANEMKDLFKIKISDMHSSCNLEEYFFYNPFKEYTKGDEKEFCKIYSVDEFIIEEKFKATDKDEFIEYIIDVYEYYNNNFKLTYGNDTMHFSFNYENPFYKSPNEFYKYGGYVRDAGSIYLIYLQPTPDEIKK